MNQENQSVCPVCSKSFGVDKINEHVNECLNTSDPNDRLSRSKKRKSSESTGNTGWGFLMSTGQSSQNVESAAKRSKVSPDKRPNTKGGNGETIVLIDCEESTKEHSSSPANSKEQSKTLKTSRSTVVQNSTEPPNTSNKTSVPKEMLTTETSTDGSSNPVPDIDMSVPLAEQMRPLTFQNYIGQDNAVGQNKMLSKILQTGTMVSVILWGPPGCGKTTLAKIISGKCKQKSKFVKLSATNSGVNDVKQVIQAAKNDYKMFKKRTMLFLDEIHRFNKLQQDSLLPHVEDGTITLIGATTENPSFQVNSALLSRCRVVVLDQLSREAVMKILLRAVDRLGYTVDGDGTEESSNVIDKAALEFLSVICDGDARVALNGLQLAVQSHSARPGLLHAKICVDDIKESLQRSHIAYDKTGDEHYHMISALHKSMRGGDDSAALYWLARMMEGGEDPRFVARRLMEFASADIGLADPQALVLAVSTYQAAQFMGKPECEKPLAECVVYLSRAPKSYEVPWAYQKAKDSIHKSTGPLPGVPLHLRNASTKLMKELGYGKGYSHDPTAKLNYMPDTMVGTNFFK